VATTTSSLFLLGVLLAFAIDAVKRPSGDERGALDGSGSAEPDPLSDSYEVNASTNESKPRSRFSLLIERPSKSRRFRVRLQRQPPK